MSASRDKLPGRPEQRERFLSAATEYALEEGISTLSLRPLAARLGTSDRMLLYYFGTRENLVTAVLDVVGQRLQGALGAGLPAKPSSPGALLSRVWAKLTDPALDSALRLYLEVDVLAARNVEPYATVANEVSTSWRVWLADRIDASTAARRTAAASALLSVLDGLLVQRLCADPDTADAAARWLAKTLN